MKSVLKTMSFLEIQNFPSLFSTGVGLEAPGVVLGVIKSVLYGFLQAFKRFL